MDQPVDLAALLVRTSTGDRAAFEHLYRATSPKLFPIALRMLRASDPAEDVLQAAYLRIWRKAEQYRPDLGNPFAWMAAIVRNCALDTLRSRALVTVSADDVADEDQPFHNIDAGALWAQVRTGDRLRHCLEGLKEQQRECILLAYYYGKSHEEIAVALDRPLGSVKSWIRRGLMMLKDCIDRWQTTSVS